jgi:hypothetical protein
VATTPLTVNVRPAAPDDLDAIADMWVQMIDEHEQIDARIWKRAAYGRQTFRTYVADSLSHDDRRVLVAEADGRIVGFIMCLVLRQPRAPGEVHMGRYRRCVRLSGPSPAWNRATARRRGCGVVHGEAGRRREAIANDAGSGFWRAMGFEPYMTQYLRPADRRSGRGEP